MRNMVLSKNGVNLQVSINGNEAAVWELGAMTAPVWEPVDTLEDRVVELYNRIYTRENLVDVVLHPIKQLGFSVRYQ